MTEKERRQAAQKALRRNMASERKRRAKRLARSRDEYAGIRGYC